jgi:predicted nucleotidyltransferase
VERTIPGLPAALVEGIEATAARQPGLRLLLVFGSQARGDAIPGSDWDLGYRATRDVDPVSLLADLVGLLGSDRIDLVDLDRASAQLRFRAASEGRVLYQAAPDAFARFWTEAVSFWCDAGPLLRAGYEDVLARLPQ